MLRAAGASPPHTSVDSLAEPGSCAIGFGHPVFEVAVEQVVQIGKGSQFELGQTVGGKKSSCDSCPPHID